MSEDGPDPLEATLRASLERLRATPDRPVVEERLGLVKRLGCRRRQRRALARGGVVAVVVTILAVSVVSALGRVEGASDRNVQVWGRPPTTGRVEAGPGTSLVAGEEPGEETTTTVTTTTTTIGPGGDSSGLPPDGGSSRAGPPSTVPTEAATSTSTSTPHVPSSTVGRLPTPPPPVTACQDQSADPVEGPVVIDATLGAAATPQCHVVRRGTVLRFRSTSSGGSISFLLDRGASQDDVLVNVLPGGATAEAGLVDVLLPPGQWLRSALAYMPSGQTGAFTPYGDLWLVAV